MIYYLNATGHLAPASEIKDKEYTSKLHKFSIPDTVCLSQFLLGKIPYAEFSVATLFHNPWPPEICIIYDTFRDEAISKAFLGCFIFNTLVEDERAWFATKSKLPNHVQRDYESMFYAPYLSRV